MTPEAMLEDIGHDGVSLALTPAGMIKATGNKPAVQRWIPRIKTNKAALLILLAKDPTVPCQHCGSGCDPIELNDETNLTVAGGKIPVPHEKPTLSVRQILERATSQVDGITPGQLFAALSPEDIRDIEVGLIGEPALNAMARSLVATYCVPPGTDIPDDPLPELVACGDCKHFEYNAEGHGGIGRCRLNAGNARSGPTKRHPAGYPIGGPLYPRVERQCKGFRSNANG